jgi:hypothetical protein
MRPLLVATCAFVAAMSSTIAPGQVRGGGAFRQPMGARQTVTPGFASIGIPQPARTPATFARQPFGIGTGSLFFYSDLGYEPIVPQPASVVVMQEPAPPTPQVEEQHPPIKPLLLELQGGHWVRVENSGAISTPVPENHEQPPEQSLQNPSVPNPLPATVLVFRNGQAEVTNGYAIIGDTLYAQSDYWTTGGWTKKIALAKLDLAATIRANQQRGVLFKLPAGPNEVVLRP